MIKIEESGVIMVYTRFPLTGHSLSGLLVNRTHAVPC